MIQTIKEPKTELSSRTSSDVSKNTDSYKQRYIESFLREFESSLTDSSYRLSYNKSLLTAEIMELYDQVCKLKEDVKFYEDPENYKPPEEIAEKHKQLEKARERWFSHMKDLIKFEDAQVGREMPKKIEVSTGTMSIQQFSDLLNQATKEVKNKEDLNE